MHWKRWLTAIVIIPPLLVFILKAGTAWFAVGLAVISALGLLEYLRMASQGHQPAIPLVFSLWILIAGAGIVWAVYQHNFVLLAAVLAVTLLAGGLFSIFRFNVDTDAPFIMVKFYFGLIYIPLLLSFLILIHKGAQGPMWVVFILWVIAWGDTGALYTGTFLGRHKLCPAVSPKKTFEGAIGGLVANLAFGWLFTFFFLPQISGLDFIVFVLCVGMVGQMGDLFESLFKRASGIKDSGNLLPGHGGILDRIDALLFAAPMAYLLKEILLP